MRSTRNFYFLIAGIVGLLLLLFLAFVGSWFQVNYQVMRDARELTEAGFAIQENRRPEEENWLTNLEDAVFSTEIPRHWSHLGGFGGEQQITADRLATIISRQRRLESVGLGADLNVRVMEELTRLPRLERLVLFADEPVDEAWISKLHPDQGWHMFQFDVPGLTPTGAATILQHCPELAHLGLRESAIDESLSTTLLARPNLQTITIWFDPETGYSPAAMQLAEQFSGDTVECVSNAKLLDQPSAKPFVIRPTGGATLGISEWSQAEVRGSLAHLNVMNCQSVDVSGAEKTIQIIDTKSCAIHDCPLLETVFLYGDSVEIAHCEKLRLIQHEKGPLKLRELPGLRRYVRSADAPRIYAELANCPSLRCIELTPYPEELPTEFPEKLDESLAPLAALPQLQSLVLRLDRPKFTHPWFAELEQLPHLKNLVLLSDHYGLSFEWSTFAAKFPPGFERVIVVHDDLNELTQSPGWDDAVARYADLNIKIEIHRGSPWELPDDLLPLAEGP